MFSKLAEVRRHVGDDLKSKTMGKWAPIVARYSFASGRLLVNESSVAVNSQRVH